MDEIISARLAIADHHRGVDRIISARLGIADHHPHADEILSARVGIAPAATPKDNAPALAHRADLRSPEEVPS